ncbi:MAG: hypothetical protein MHM6MM_003304 [Cercozoa sp. M6MM]
MSETALSPQAISNLTLEGSSRHERATLLKALTKLMCTCLEQFHMTMYSEDVDSEGPDYFDIVGFDDDDFARRKMKSASRTAVESFVRKHGQQLARHCDLLIYVGHLDTVVHGCRRAGPDASLYLSRTILETLRQQRGHLSALPIILAVHGQLRSVVSSLGLGVRNGSYVQVPLFYSRLDRYAMWHEDTGLSAAWCDLPPETRALMWLLSIHEPEARGKHCFKTPQRVIKDFAEAFAKRHAKLLQVAFPAFTEEFRIVILRALTPLGGTDEPVKLDEPKDDWIAALNRILQKPSLDALCLQSRDAEQAFPFDQLDQYLAAQVLRHFECFLSDSDTFAALDDDIKTRVIALYHLVFGIEMTEEGAKLRKAPPHPFLKGSCFRADLRKHLHVSRHNVAFLMHLLEACWREIRHLLTQAMREEGQTLHRPVHALLGLLYDALHAAMRQSESRRFVLSTDMPNESLCKVIESAESGVLLHLNKQVFLMLRALAIRLGDETRFQEFMDEAISAAEVSRVSTGS